MANVPTPVAENKAPPPLLFTPFCSRGLTLKNRIMVSAMAMYSSSGGFTDDFHLVHLGRFALGGAGLIMTEATAVTEDGRIKTRCHDTRISADKGGRAEFPAGWPSANHHRARTGDLVIVDVVTCGIRKKASRTETANATSSRAPTSAATPFQPSCAQ